MVTSLNLINNIENQKKVARKLHDAFIIPLREETIVLDGRYKSIIDEEEDLDEYEDNEEVQDIIGQPRIVVAGGAPRDWYIGKTAKDIDMYFMFPSFEKFFQKIGNKGQFWSKFYKKHDGGMFTIKGLSQIYTAIERDFFVDSILPKSPLLLWVGNVLLEQGLIFSRLTDKTLLENSYTNPFIKCVFELELDGVVFDLIFFQENREGVLYTFDNQEFITTSAFAFMSTNNNTFGDFVTGTFDFNICKIYYDILNDTIVPSKEFLEDLNNKTLTIYRGMQTNQFIQSIYKHYPKLQQKFVDFKFNPVILQK